MKYATSHIPEEAQPTYHASLFACLVEVFRATTHKQLKLINQSKYLYHIKAS